MFCALSYSSSATVVIAWLLEQGLAVTLDDAIAKVQLAHVNVVLSLEHRENLQQWHQLRFKLHHYQ